MTLVQKRIYLQRLFEYDSAQTDKQKQIIEQQIINQLSSESRYHKKHNNNQQLSLLSKKIQSIINLLQYPSDCSKARIIVCPLHTQCCGLGCIMHQICYCLALAAGSGRTVILDNEDTKIYKFNVKWSELFEPLTNCSYTKHVKPFLPLKNYEEPGQTDKILYFEYRPELVRRGFDVAPIEFKHFLLKYTSNPVLWFRGQLIKYVWREKEVTKKETDQIVSRIPFECGPVVGIHVRRTDKTSESKIQKLEDYMKWVDFWFDVNEENYKNNQTINSNNCTNKRILFVASDLPVLENVVKEVKNKWGDIYEIYHGTIFKDESQYETWEASAEILAVSRILAKCQFLVCTHSSNGARIIYELMQSIQGDARENAHSIDYLYGQYWNENEMEAISDYKPIPEYPATPEELWAEKGDIIVVKSAIHKDGFIRGRNQRLNTEGNFPMYLLKDHLKFINFSAFVDI